MTDADKTAYTKFLSNLLKDKAYVEMAYMTGILPIAKYSSGSELNMFFEYSMATRAKFSEYFGFTDDEVNLLYQRYLQIEKNPSVTREGLELWYDGYQTAGGKKLYNPRSVVGALSDNQLGNYWTSSGPYDEIFYYIGANVDAVKDDIALMVADIPVPAKIQEYAATSMELKTKDEIFSAMVVYGFLNYSKGYISIPNKELMDKFAEVIQREPSLGNVYKLAKESGRMLAATKAGDTKTMAELLEYAHNTHSPLTLYNNEAELASIIRWVYLKALDFYRIEREDKAGIGYVDFIFYPCMSYNIDEGESDNHFNCPVVAYYPELLIANNPRLNSNNFIYPYMDLNREKNVTSVMYEILKKYGIKKPQVKQAVKKSYEKLADYRNEIFNRGNQIISKARENGQKIIVLSGRPYHIDKEINHGIQKLITSLGMAVVSEDAVFQYGHYPNPGVLNQWSYHARLYRAAQYVTTQPDMQLVQLVSFGCGIDAITTD